MKKKNIMRISFLIVALACASLFFVFRSDLIALNAYGRVLAVTPSENDAAVPLKGKLKIFPLTSKYLVIAGDYDDFLNERIHASHGKRLALADELNKKGELQDWALRFYYSFAFADVASYYHKRICDNFNGGEYFRLSSPRGGIGIRRSAYMPGSSGEKRIPASFGQPHIASGAEIIHFQYIELERPLENGEELTIETADGAMKTTFVYSDTSSVSRAVKVNQEGYMPDAAKKYAYFGMWLGPLGAMPPDDFENKPFELVNMRGEAVYTGVIRKRSDEQYHKFKDGKAMPLNGETVMELEFSSFTVPGEYRVRVPGAGVSWPFVISSDAIGKAFYTSMRGLYLQRSGIAKTPEYTKWNFNADHMLTYRGGFAPNDRHYSKQSGAMFDKAGNPASVKHFDMVAATATDEVVPGLNGGWWDAGDFDRRTYHFEVVDSLLSAYFMFPENFSDSQLDIPESGNGVPDIIDEAAWGVDVWRRAQNPAGGVGCWIEAVSHPVDGNPDTDAQRYYLALPTRESSMEYAAYAAKLARAYKHAGAVSKAELFYESAVRAYDYAKAPSNRQERAFTVPGKGDFVYREPERIPVKNEFKAALNLYFYSGDVRYEEFLESKLNFDEAFKIVRENKRPYFLSELMDNHEFPEYRREYEKYVVSQANTLMRTQESFAYRNINWPLDHAYFTYLAWGAGLPFYKGAFIIAAWRITREEQYRTSALLLADWMLGANPMGRSLTTGLGKVFPVRLLSHPVFTLEKRGIIEPIPGITPYTFSGDVNYAAAKYVFKMDYSPRKDTNFKGCDVTLMSSLWLDGRESVTQKECYALLRKNIPFWRRFINLESKAVNQNEFTVWETMAPLAAAYGALLKPGWKPGADWKNRAPVTDKDKLEGYIFLP